MPLFARARSDDPTLDQKFVHSLKEELASRQERNVFLLETVRSLLVFLKDFSMDLNDQEVDPQRFRQEINGLSEKFATTGKTRSLAAVYRKYRKKIYVFITGQKAYLAAREAELKEIIDLLTRAMATLDADNQVFNQAVYQQTEKIEELRQLDDIRKIKDSLSIGVSRLRTAVREKRMRDSRRLENLSKRVKTLNRELEATRAESMTDGLTGVYNRKALDGYLIDLVERNLARREPFCLLLLDIDDFKAVNDTFGHQVGDRVLIAVARQCRTIIRDDDFIGRYGGEEFAVVIPGVSLRVARKRAEQLCRKIADTRYELDEEHQRGVLGVTVSIGVSSYRRGDTVSAVVARADKSLYAAKAGGKNRVATEKQLS